MLEDVLAQQGRQVVGGSGVGPDSDFGAVPVDPTVFCVSEREDRRVAQQLRHDLLNESRSYAVGLPLVAQQTTSSAGLGVARRIRHDVALGDQVLAFLFGC